MADLQVAADPGTHEIQITRSLDAPRELVYKAFTDPDTVRRWLRETVTFEGQDGKTHMTDISMFQSVADRDGMLRSGMESGAAGSFDRLDEYLARG